MVECQPSKLAMRVRFPSPAPRPSRLCTEGAMNKEGLVDYVAAATGETRKQVSQVLDAILAGITDALRRDEKVTLVGFGTFQVRSRAAREGRNPRTGEKIQIPARKAPAFTAGKDLKAELGRS